MRRRRSPARMEGFTLVEMLVVITVIIILAALLFPAISAIQARNRAARWRGYLGGKWLPDSELMFCFIFEEGNFSDSDWQSTNLATAGSDAQKFTARKCTSATNSVTVEYGGGAECRGRFSGTQAGECRRGSASAVAKGFVVENLPTGNGDADHSQLRSRTVSLWFNPDKGSTVTDVCLAGFGGADMSHGADTVIGIDSSKKVAVWVNGTKELTGSTSIDGNDSTAPNAGWYHVAVTLDPDATGANARLFVNGVQEDSKTISGLAAETGANFYISRKADVGVTLYGFNGRVDEVELFKRALSEQEIKDYYKAADPDE